MPSGVTKLGFVFAVSLDLRFVIVPGQVTDALSTVFTLNAKSLQNFVFAVFLALTETIR